MLQTYQGQVINGNLIFSEKVNLPEKACFIITILDSDNQAQIDPQSTQLVEYTPQQSLSNRKYSPEEKKIAMQAIRDLLAGIDGNSIDLKQARAERRASKYERVD